jgi:hypothetical protein
VYLDRIPTIDKDQRVHAFVAQALRDEFEILTATDGGTGFDIPNRVDLLRKAA